MTDHKDTLIETPHRSAHQTAVAGASWTDTTLSARFQHVAAMFPDNIAIHTPDESLTYRELDRRTNQLANALLKHGIPRDLPVGLFLSHGIPAITGLLGAMKAGHFYFGLDPAYPPAHNAAIFAHAAPHVLITSRSLRAQADALLDAHQPPLVVDLEDLLAQESDSYPDVEVSPDDNAMLMVVVAEGLLKGVLTQHHAQLFNAYSWAVDFDLNETHHFSHLLSYSISASRTEIFFSLMVGATIHPYSLRQHGLQGLGDWMIRESISHTNLIPGIFRAMAHSLPEGTLLSDLHYMSLVGEAVTPSDVDLFRRFTPPSSILVNFYGAAETGSIAAYPISSDTVIDTDTVPVGYPLAQREILIVDDDAHPLPRGATGEIVVRSAHMARGYWRMPTPPPGSFIPDPEGGSTPAYLTGDRGYLDGEGRLHVVGRQDTLIKIRGYRVIPSDVEKALQAHPGIGEAAVFASEDSRGEKRVAAYLVGTDQVPVAASDLREYLGRRMPQYCIPSYFIFRDDLPRTATGKVDQRALPRPDSSRPNLPTAYLRPRDALETRLTSVWEDVMGVYPVGIHDDFFELGGHSLLALELFARIENELGRALPMNALFDASTIAGFADILRADTGHDQSQTLIALRSEGARPPLFVVHPAGGHVLSYYHLVRHLDPDQPVYGLQARGLDGKDTPHDTIEAMAAHYVQEMRRIQPAGPYRLAGYSMGGKIAYEMARLLEAEASPSDTVILLDTYFSGQNREQPELGLIAAAPEPDSEGKADPFFALRRDWKAMHAMTLRARLQYMAGQTRDRWRWHVLRRLRGERVLNDPDRWTPARRVQEACYRANRHYEVRPYGGSLIFIRASSDRLEDSLSLWEAVVSGGVQVIDLEATHRSLMEEPVVQHLARHIQDLLA